MDLTRRISLNFLSYGYRIHDCLVLLLRLVASESPFADVEWLSGVGRKMRDRHFKMKCQLPAPARTKFIFATGTLAFVSLISFAQWPFPELPVPFPSESRLCMYGGWGRISVI